MRILVVGSGGREHAICDAFSRSPRVDKVFCAPGNGGISEIAECVDIKAEAIDELARFAAEQSIDLTFVGGETALALGIVDTFEKRGLRILGPTAAAAQLESSKAFAKSFMLRHAIPTARFQTALSPAEAIAILESGHFGEASAQVVVKADGLAAGKGVVVALDRSEAISACNELASLVGDHAAEKIVLEEFLDGHEVSLLMFVDGQNYSLMPPVRDHKRIGEGDTGPNTGGMGTVTDAGLLTSAQMQEIINDIIGPTLKGCASEGFTFRGILFLGLMMTEGGPKVLEYNVRFGDPETQAILIRLETDFTSICDAMLDGKLAHLPIEWHGGNSACVVLASEGYPQTARTGDVIRGLERASAEPNVKVFHAGTKKSDSEFVTTGGRVLGVTATGETMSQALQTAYAVVDLISWPGMQYRRDIGRSV